MGNSFNSITRENDRETKRGGALVPVVGEQVVGKMLGRWPVTGLRTFGKLD